MKLVKPFALLTMITGLALGLVAYYVNSAPEDATSSSVYFNIRKGETLSVIASRLESKGLIRSGFFLKAMAKILGTERDFMAGYYRIKRHDTTLDIHNTIVRGSQSYKRITIPEGWTKTKIARHFEAEGISNAGDLLAAFSSKTLLEKYKIPGSNLEGYLKPDTYYFSDNLPPEVIADKLVATFFTTLGEIVPDYRSMPPKQLHDKIILASIIEREYRVASEAPIIASVFYNRLRVRVGLESCATLEYIITEIQGRPHPTFITLDMKAIDSLYNTYKWHGLPPGPVSNPGAVALRASFFPAKTDYWFFVVKNPETGEHYFSKELDEHNEAKYYYLKGVGKPPKPD